MGGAGGGVVMEGMGRATEVVLEGCFDFVHKKTRRNLTYKKEMRGKL